MQPYRNNSRQGAFSGRNRLTVPPNGGPAAQTCPPQPWPANLPPCPTKRLGLTDPLQPHAAHPVRFSQLQQQRTALAVYNGNDPGGQASLASIAGQEHARRRLFTATSQSCAGGLNHILVSLNSSQADASRISKQNTKSGDDKQEEYETIVFNIALENSIVDLIAHRLVFGQVKSWEIDLSLRCIRDPPRARAIIDAPVNHEPIFGEDRYTLPISELYDITCARQTLNLQIKGGRCPSVTLPLTLSQVLRITAYRMPIGSRSQSMRAYESASAPLPLYVFRTREPQGYVPGLVFYLSLSSTGESNDSDPFVPRNGDRFVVVDTMSYESHNSGCGLDCYEFVALRCRRAECAAREARVFAPWDECIECQKYGCDGPRMLLPPLPEKCEHFLRYGHHDATDDEDNDDDVDDKQNGVQFPKEDEEEEADDDDCADKDVYITIDLSDDCAFVYVPPPTSPEQLVCLVNGTLRAQIHCGFNAFNQLGVYVSYDALIDQYVVSSERGCIPMRSLFGDMCDTATTFNFPLNRKAMIVSECTLEYKQRYLERVVSGFYYFDVRAEKNDRFCVRLECGTAAERKKREIIVPPACYAARFFVAALERAMNDAFDEPDLFEVRYELFDTERLVAARIKNKRRDTAQMVRPSATRIGPYRNLTFAIVIAARDPRRAFSVFFDKSDESRAFANLIDYDPRQHYELRSFYTSRSLSLGCVDAPSQRKWIAAARKCSISCAPCPHRKYEALVDPACGIVSLQQRIQRPYCVEKYADSNDDKCDVEHRCCEDALRVCIKNADKRDPPVMFCTDDVLIASKCNPLCTDGRPCNEDEVLVVIVGECAYDEFVLSFDPFPDCANFWLWAMPVGFNLHLHRNKPNLSTFNYFDQDKSEALRIVAESNAVTRFLGFICPSTRSGAFCYASDQTPATIVDENLLLRVRELVPLSIGEGRNTLYTPESPFDKKMTEYYAQLLIDRSVGQYRAFPALTSPLPQLSAPQDVLPSPGASNIACPSSMTVELLRPDGSVYLRHGNPFTLTFELIFVRK